MIDAFLEGVRSIGQACQLVILVPVAMVVLASRGRWAAVGGAVTGVVVGGWLFATRWIVLDDTWIRLSGLLLMVGLGVLVAPSVARRTARSERGGRAASLDVLDGGWTVATTNALCAALVTTWWRPCVGEQLGEILTLAPRQPWGQLFPTVGFMAGVSIPLVMIGAATAVWRPRDAVATTIAIVAAGVGVLLAVTVVVGQHGEIVAKSFEWSQ